MTQCTARCASTPMPGLLEAHVYHLCARRNTVSVPAAPWRRAGLVNRHPPHKSHDAAACQRSTAGARTALCHVVTRGRRALPHRPQAVRTARRARSARRRRRRARWSGWPRGAARPRAGAARAGPRRRRPHARASSWPAPAARARPPAPARCRTSRPSAPAKSPPPARPPRTPALRIPAPQVCRRPSLPRLCRARPPVDCARCRAARRLARGARAARCSGARGMWHAPACTRRVSASPAR
jgi:hypothetical protein